MLTSLGSTRSWWKAEIIEGECGLRWISSNYESEGMRWAKVTGLSS